jgi:cyclic pyranopterin monophosphate synthase
MAGAPRPDRPTGSNGPPGPGGGPRPIARTRADRRALTHLGRSGRPRMVDVSEKPATARRAVAEAELHVSQETISLVVDGGGPKGDVLTVAELAGVLAAKRTSELIPLAHPLPLTDVSVEIRPDRAASAFRIRASAATIAPTGVEMEALVAAAIAGLTVYDMIKAVERGAELRGLRLVEKSGGRSGEWRRPAESERPAASGRGVAQETRRADDGPSTEPSRRRGVRGAGRIAPGAYRADRRAPGR